MMKTVNTKLATKLSVAFKRQALQNMPAIELTSLLTSTHKAIDKIGVQQILLPIKDEYLVARVDQILYVESNGNYCFVHLTEGRRFLISCGMKLFVDKYALPFMRCHKSYLVNPEFIVAIKQDRHLRLSTDRLIPIARRKYSEVLAYFGR